jgi:hypothetical protein
LSDRSFAPLSYTAAAEVAMVRWRWFVVLLGAVVNAGVTALAGCTDEPEPLALCEGVRCSDRGVCRTDGFSANCECAEGYRAQGLACVVDSGGDADADADTDADADADGTPCPEGMVYVEPEDLCIDSYEASRGAGDTAISEQGRQPWVQVAWAAAAAACDRAGKELCSSEAWLAACGGPDEWLYPYGQVFVQANCADAYTYVSEPMLTGSMPHCEGFYEGLFDMSGNVAEWTGDVVDGQGHIAVGTFHDDADRLLCNAFTPVPVYEDFDDVGFRCCLRL